MANYLVQPDDYAGWNPTGRNFSLICAAAGAIGLLSWMAVHGYLGGYHPTEASDQIFFTGLVWLGAGACCIGAMGALGSISLSRKSRGSVSITEEGVIRVLGKLTETLLWPEIQGLVPMPAGGVTLISIPGKPLIVIPRHLDDYRACIAEIKDHGIQRLPPSSLRRREKVSWKTAFRNFACVFFYILAVKPGESHGVRIASFAAAVAFMIWMLQVDWMEPRQRTSRWFTLAALLAVCLWILWRMAHTW